MAHIDSLVSIGNMKMSKITYMFPFAHLNVEMSKSNIDDLIAMGEVAKAEYVFWIDYIKRHGRYPIFNDKNSSPKPNFVSVSKVKILK